MKLSIVTINLNNADGLEKTIKSVLSQTFSDYEYLVIDGGSTDKSCDVIQQYANQINYWESKPDNGIYHAMNKGILKAKGDYCLFLNSGDILCSKTILNDVFEQNFTEDIVYGNLTFDSQGNLAQMDYPDVLQFSFLYKNSLPHPSMFIKKELFEHLGLYNESYRIISDWTFYMLAICKHNCSYRHIKDVVSVFNMDGISSTLIDVVNDERNHFLEENFPIFCQDAAELHLSRRQLRKVKKNIIYKVVALIRRLLGKNIL